MSADAAEMRLRRCPRVGLGVDGAIAVELWGSRLDPSRGWVTVLGAGGVFVEISDNFSVGESLELRFRLPETKDDIDSGGVVRNCVPEHGIGIEFTRIASGDREMVAVAVTRSMVRQNDDDAGTSPDGRILDERRLAEAGVPMTDCATAFKDCKRAGS